MFAKFARRMLVVLAFAIVVALPQAAFALDGTPSLVGAQATSAQTAAKMPDASVQDGVFTMAPRNAQHLTMASRDNAQAGSKPQLAMSATLNSNWQRKWILASNGTSGTYTVRNLETRLVLGLPGAAKAGVAVKLVNPAKVAQKRCSWILSKSGTAIVLRPAANPKLALTAVGSGKSATLKLTRLKAQGTKLVAVKAQKFGLDAIDALEDGQSFFIQNARTGKAVTVPNDSRKESEKLVLAKRKDVRYQKFRVLKRGKSYLLQAAASCKYVGASGALTRQYASSKGKAKRWRIALDLPTGTFTFTSLASGKRLDACSGKLGVRAKASKAAQLTAQRFALTPTYGFKLYLDPGHGWYNSIYDPGALGSGRQEADLTRDLADRIEAALKGSDIEVVNGGQFHLDYYRRNAKAASLGCDLVLSVHFDAGGGTTTATMIGTSGPLAKSKAFNRILHPALVSSTGLSDGGTMVRSDITIVNGSVPAVLMEVAFIDNSSCLGKYLNRRDAVANAIADAIVKTSRTL